jgi:hypothetical protein
MGFISHCYFQRYVFPLLPMSAVILATFLVSLVMISGVTAIAYLFPHSHYPD